MYNNLFLNTYKENFFLKDDKYKIRHKITEYDEM